MWIHPLELPYFFVKRILGVVGPILCSRFCALLEDFFLERVCTQLILDGLHLLMQKELPLLLVKVCFNLALNVLLERKHLFLFVEQFEDFLGSLTQIDFLEDSLLVLNLDLHVAAYKIYQESQSIDPFDCFSCFRGNVGVHFDEFGRQIAQTFHHGLSFFFG